MSFVPFFPLQIVNSNKKSNCFQLIFELSSKRTHSRHYYIVLLSNRNIDLINIKQISSHSFSFRIPKSPFRSIFFLRLSCCDFFFRPNKTKNEDNNNKQCHRQRRRSMEIHIIEWAILRCVMCSQTEHNECIAHIANSKR